jgi:hypothetical protein
LYEDRIVVVRARSHDAAQQKANRIVRDREAPYKNPLGNVVRWRVTKVFESVKLFEDEANKDGFKDGAQVYWRYIRSSDPERRLKKEGTMNALY